jgi:beta-galactosidase/beta-glucuronidase
MAPSHPIPDHLRTPWVPETPIPLSEYPRPQLTRPGWINLNGKWDYTILPASSTHPETFEGSILVPFAVESLLSGVQRPLLPGQMLWYRRHFADPRPELLQNMHTGGRILLHFGAVDYGCDIWVNGFPVGLHRGGYLPFTLDITGSLREGENELLVCVWDPTDTGMQQRGKQVLKPHSIWYTPVSGIWQTIWLEGVPEVSIESLKLTPDLDHQRLILEAGLRGDGDLRGYSLEYEALREGKTIASGSALPRMMTALTIPEPRVWSPEYPFLYDLIVRLVKDGALEDAAGSYFAMRKFSLVNDEEGHARFALNDKPLFLYGPLDQGYFPDGLYTPPSEEAMLFDIEYAKRIGCNLIRKHVKVEPLRWYYLCDRLGMIVWQDMPNGGKIDGEVIAFLNLSVGWHRDDTRGLGRFGRSDENNREEFRSELKGMIDHLHNAACIACWVPFNESWGQFQSQEIADWVLGYDPTRLVDHASGWFDQGGGDFQSRHVYVKKLPKKKHDARAYAVTEFGGYTLKVPGHMWDPGKKFGYRFYESSKALTSAYLDLLENQVKPLIPEGLAVAIYTQTTDVEIEANGFLTYDRKVEKMDTAAILLVNREITSSL